MLGNINPSKRSKLRGIQLLVLCKQKMIKRYGINQIIKPIVNDIKLLVNIRLTDKAKINNNIIIFPGTWA